MSFSTVFTFCLYQGLPYLVFTKPCHSIVCSNVYDPVCGEATTLDERKVTQRFQNICYLRLLQCQFRFTGLQQIPDKYCDIRKADVFPTTGRRLYDFSIVGAHQACNHTCPTYCLDTYDPACAQIWSSNMQSYHYRPMINHCHIDMFSCVVGVMGEVYPDPESKARVISTGRSPLQVGIYQNVTIQPLIGKCYKNPSAINFMFNIASLKTLKLLDEAPTARGNGRRAYASNTDGNQLLEAEIRGFVRALLFRV